MTEKQFYKLDEYSKKLPNPRLFPISNYIAAISDCPNMFSDGYIMDLEVGEKDRKRLEGNTKRTMPKHSIDLLIKNAKDATILLSEPRYIYKGYEHITYVLFTPDNKPVGIQVRYYRYFRNRYPDCNFYTSGERPNVKAVCVENKLVGLWMAVMLPRMEELEYGKR